MGTSFCANASESPEARNDGTNTSSAPAAATAAVTSARRARSGLPVDELGDDQAGDERDGRGPAPDGERGGEPGEDGAVGPEQPGRGEQERERPEEVDRGRGRDEEPRVHHDHGGHQAGPAHPLVAQERGQRGRAADGREQRAEVRPDGAGRPARAAPTAASCTGAPGARDGRVAEVLDDGPAGADHRTGVEVRARPHEEERHERDREQRACHQQDPAVRRRSRLVDLLHLVEVAQDRMSAVLGFGVRSCSKRPNGTE